MKKQFYLHVSDRTGKNVLGRDIELPERFVAYKFENNIIYGIQVDKQKLYLVELEL